MGPELRLGVSEVLETGGGKGCTTVRTRSVPLSCALKMIKMVNFMSSLLCNNKKKILKGTLKICIFYWM